MTTEYKFNTPTNSTTFYTKSSTRFYAAGTISANTDSNTLSLGMSGLLDVTLAGAKITVNTPLVLALSASLALTWEWQGGTNFKYTGIGAEQSTVEMDNALAKTGAALSTAEQGLVKLEERSAALANSAVDVSQNAISVSA
jgi:hypothetical protein